MLRTITLLPALVLASTLFSATGGPDQYGYIWKDSNEPGGPVYAWIDITTNGALINGLGDDNIVGPYTMETDQPFYWYGRKNFWVGSNGYIAFNSGNIASPFPTIPLSGGVNDYVAAMMSDLNFAGVGNPGRCYWHDGEDRTVISYINVPFWTSAAPNYTGSNTFQIILDKNDSTITIQYQLQTGTTNNSDLLIGIESVAGSIGLQHSADLYPPTNFAIRFYLPPASTLAINDATIGWNSIPGNGGQFISRNGSAFPLISNVANTGNTELTNVQVSANVKNGAGVVQVNSSAVVPLITPTLDADVLFSAAFTPATSGTYSFTSTISNVPNELVVTNNTRIQELVVVDTTLMEHDLRFTGPQDDAIGLSWDGGNGGVAMYLVPPYYPAYAGAATIRISSNAGLSGFSVKVYDDNGPNGSAGTLLDSVDVPVNAATAGDHVIALNSTLSITSGGVYVLWYMNGPNINIAQDILPPFSLRTYEVLGNTWAEYRDRENVDFHIGLRLVQAPVFDIGCSGFFGVAPGQNIGQPTTVRAWITNNGNQPASGFSMSYRFANGPVVAQTYNGPAVQPGQQVLFNFAQQFSPTADAAGNLCAWSTWAPDINAANDSTCVPVNVFVGMQEHEQLVLRAYPNPTSDRLLIQGFPQGTYLLRVFDSVGREVIHTNKVVGVAPLSIDTEDLEEGSYVLQLIGNEERGLARFTIQR